MTVDVQCGTGLEVTQKARHRSNIRALGDEHAGIGVAQTVHIQIFWQTVLTKYFFEPKGEGAGHHIFFYLLFNLRNLLYLIQNRGKPKLHRSSLRLYHSNFTV